MKLNEKVRIACKLEGKSLDTERRYLQWVNQYTRFLKLLPNAQSLSSEQKVSGFLCSIAESVSKRTQNNAVCSLVWFYKAVLEQPLGRIPGWKPARDFQNLPVWLSRSELESLLSQMRGETLLMALLGAGSGMRRREIVNLRIKDVDFENNVIHVRFGKGGKSRPVCLPRRAIPLLREQIERARTIHAEDRRNHRNGVELPDALEKKCPAWAKDFSWFWLFFARNESQDPRSGIIRRHHLDPSTYQKAVKVAGKRARIDKCLKTHVLRHTYATEHLNNGGNIKELKELLGHADIRVTEIYTHVAHDFAARIKSPIDREPSNVVPFASPTPEHKAFALQRSHQ